MDIYDEHSTFLRVFTRAWVDIYHTRLEPQRIKLFHESSQEKQAFR